MRMIKWKNALIFVEDNKDWYLIQTSEDYVTSAREFVHWLEDINL